MNDLVFQLDAASRAEFLQLLIQTTGCTYICLWSYVHSPNCLVYWDGCYNNQSNQPRAYALFVAYRQQVFSLENDPHLVPGFAFRNNSPYIEFGEPELQNRVSNPIQTLFYQETGVKKVVFMGCRSGEIELGLVQLNMGMEIRRFFHEDLTRLSSSLGDQPPQPQQTDPNRLSSSSSSLRSLSTGSPDSSLIFTIPTNAAASHPQLPATTAVNQTQPSSVPQGQAISSTIPDPQQQAIQAALSHIRRDIQLPTMESENAEMARAFLAILTSPPSSSSSSSSTSHQNLHPNVTAFKSYARHSMLGAAPTAIRGGLRAQSMVKRAIFFYRGINMARRQEMLRIRPNISQMHHMISERKRREKINESFHALRSLLPNCTKKDKASILASAKEYLASLKDQIVELSQRNQLLEGQLLPGKDKADVLLPNERYNVGIAPVAETTSEQRIIDLRVSVRGGRPTVDVLMQLLEFLNLDRNVSLMSIEADTCTTESDGVFIHRINMRLRIEGSGWDESTFQEAVRRLVADLAQ